MKLAEIPVYALSYDDFVSKVNKCKQRHFKKYGTGASEISFETEYGNSRFYNYNHIIGYVVVLKKRDDISFELYKTDVQRYHWDSQKKHCFYNVMINGRHFRLDKNMTSEDVRKRINKYVDDIIDEFFPKQSWADRQILTLILTNMNLLML